MIVDDCQVDRRVSKLGVGRAHDRGEAVSLPVRFMRAYLL
jgi:hypothetical protein